jgi:hypothetical protein
LLTNQMNRNSGIESGFEVNRAFRGKNIFEWKKKKRYWQKRLLTALEKSNQLFRPSWNMERYKQPRSEVQKNGRSALNPPLCFQFIYLYVIAQIIHFG